MKIMKIGFVIGMLSFSLWASAQAFNGFDSLAVGINWLPAYIESEEYGRETLYDTITEQTFFRFEKDHTVIACEMGDSLIGRWQLNPQSGVLTLTEGSQSLEFDLRKVSAAALVMYSREEEITYYFEP
ncbi:MAG TPA: hypothetical protein DCG19_06700 [Cryomorphaceae bacterium]|nr:hypothetical protein [Cryomorphaceae bacterium]